MAALLEDKAKLAKVKHGIGDMGQAVARAADNRGSSVAARAPSLAGYTVQELTPEKITIGDTRMGQAAQQAGMGRARPVGTAAVDRVSQDVLRRRPTAGIGAKTPMESVGRAAGNVYKFAGGGGGALRTAGKMFAPALAAYDTATSDYGVTPNANNGVAGNIGSIAAHMGVKAGDWGTKGLDLLTTTPINAIAGLAGVGGTPSMSDLVTGNKPPLIEPYNDIYRRQLAGRDIGVGTIGSAAQVAQNAAETPPQQAGIGAVPQAQANPALQPTISELSRRSSQDTVMPTAQPLPAVASPQAQQANPPAASGIAAPVNQGTINVSRDKNGRMVFSGDNVGDNFQYGGEWKGKQPGATFSVIGGGIDGKAGIDGQAKSGFKTTEGADLYRQAMKSNSINERRMLLDASNAIEGRAEKPIDKLQAEQAKAAEAANKRQAQASGLIDQMNADGTTPEQQTALRKKLAVLIGEKDTDRFDFIKVAGGEDEFGVKQPDVVLKYDKTTGQHEQVDFSGQSKADTEPSTMSREEAKKYMDAYNSDPANKAKVSMDRLVESMKLKGITITD